MKIERNNTTGYSYSLSFKFDYEMVEYCKYLSDKYGFKRFSFLNGAWRFTDIDFAVELKDRYPEIEIDEEIKMEYELARYLTKEAILAKANADRLKKTKESNIKIKGIKGELLPYQKVGVEFFINSNGRAMNSDPMGAGKTVQALAYITHSDIKKTLVICPAVVKYNWKAEVEKWTDLKVMVIDSDEKELTVIENINKHQIFVINYDILKKFFKVLSSISWEACILDEVHYIKNKSAFRSRATKKLVAHIPKILMLSGTPFLSRPIELFNPLNTLDPKNWFDYYAYSRRYCNGHMGRFGWDDRGSTNITELQERISPYFIRRSKKEILPDLPEKRFIYHPLELDPVIAEKYKMAEEEFGRFLINIKKKTEKEAARSMQAEKLVKLGALRQLSSLGKIEQSKEIIQNIIENGEKVVVFSCYNEPLEQLHKYFKDISVLVTGKIDAEERNNIVNEFQSKEKLKIFFGGIKSAGVGINLTAATNVVFLDYSWTPADHSQAIDRIHRIGSTSEHITIYQLYSKKTVDEYMFKLLGKKQLLFDQLIDGAEIPREGFKSYASSIIKSIELKEKRRIVKEGKSTLPS